MCPAERKLEASTLEPDADNTDVGSHKKLITDNPIRIIRYFFAQKGGEPGSGRGAPDALT